MSAASAVPSTAPPAAVVGRRQRRPLPPTLRLLTRAVGLRRPAEFTGFRRNSRAPATWPAPRPGRRRPMFTGWRANVHAVRRGAHAALGRAGRLWLGDDAD